MMEEGTIKRNMQLSASKVWIWRGVGQSDVCDSIWWLLHEVRLLSWWQCAVEFVTSSLCVCVCTAVAERLFQDRHCILSVLQCIERTGLANSCKSSRVVQECDAWHRGPFQWQSGMNVWVKTFGCECVFVCMSLAMSHSRCFSVRPHIGLLWEDNIMLHKKKVQFLSITHSQIYVNLFWFLCWRKTKAPIPHSGKAWIYWPHNKSLKSLSLFILLFFSFCPLFWSGPVNETQMGSDWVLASC